MITFETKANGIMISHIIARDYGTFHGDTRMYGYEYHQAAEGHRRPIVGFVTHDSKEPGMTLLSAILEDVRSRHGGL